MDDAMKELITKHIRSGREHHRKETERVDQVAALNTKLIFLNAFGRVNPLARPDLNQILEDMQETIRPTSEPPTSENETEG